MSLANARINPPGKYFRDHRAASLEDQVLTPFTDPLEMGLKAGELVRRVSGRVWYGPLFRNAFGDTDITEARIASALAQFVSAMVSVGSRYDSARAAAPDAMAPFGGFDETENRGKTLFFTAIEDGGAGCSGCHETEWFVFLRPHDNGLAPGHGHKASRPDGGIGEVTGRMEEIGTFRAPSLRNIAVSAPYMRDGRFKTLEEVVGHYADGVTLTPNLDEALKSPGGSPRRLLLPEADRSALVAFLRTLTDDGFLSDPKFADPFRTD
jgi:cytochrome c peroxidase